MVKKRQRNKQQQREAAKRPQSVTPRLPEERKAEPIENDTQANNTAKRKISIWRRVLDWLPTPEGTAVMMVFLTSVIALTGVVGIVFVTVQIHESRLSARPWVGPTFATPPILIGKSGDPIRWKIEFKNFGNSPAQHTQWHTRLYPPVPAGSENWKGIESDIENLYFDPKMEFFLLTGEPGLNDGQVPPIPDTVRSDIIARSYDLILGGRVAYQDGYGNQHETTFGVTFQPGGKLASGEEVPDGWLECPVIPKVT